MISLNKNKNIKLIYGLILSLFLSSFLPYQVLATDPLQTDESLQASETVAPNESEQTTELLEPNNLVQSSEPMEPTDSVQSTDPKTIPPSIIVKEIDVNDFGETIINGIVSDNLTSSEDIEMKLVYKDVTDNNRLIEIESISPASDGTWTIKRKITEKLNRYFLVATDKPLIDTDNVNETMIPVQRPFIKSIKLTVIKYRHKIIEIGVRNDRFETEIVDIMQNEDMTRVSINPTEILIDLSDQVSTNMSNPISIYDKNFKLIPGDFSFVSPNQIQITLNNLNFGKTYYLLFNPTLISKDYIDNSSVFIDDVDNQFSPIFKKFTTVSETVMDTNPDKAIDEYSAEWENQPHGFYTSNVNTCVNCHSTHVSDKIRLDKPIDRYKEKASQSSYCMACHDGTVVAPLPENYDTSASPIISRHNAIENIDHTVSAGSCTSCHNPHLSWNAENPNLLKDQYVYQHAPSDEWNGVPVGEIDSSIQLCEVCHGERTNEYKNRAENVYIYQHKPEDIKDGKVVGKIDTRIQSCETCHSDPQILETYKLEANKVEAYKILHYRKQSSAIGEITVTEQINDGISSQISQVEDYNLCFSCHNSIKQEKYGTKDILSYYINSESKHFIRAIDGSQLNGQIPCAECHVTHAATNLKLLKKRFGHENQTSDFLLTNEAPWNPFKEREFCLKCHNGETAIFGVTGKALDHTKSPTGHVVDSQVACSSCHSSNLNSDSESFSKDSLEAVHAPKTGKNP